MRGRFSIDPPRKKDRASLEFRRGKEGKSNFEYSLKARIRADVMLARTNPIPETFRELSREYIRRSVGLVGGESRLFIYRYMPRVPMRCGTRFGILV